MDQKVTYGFPKGKETSDKDNRTVVIVKYGILSRTLTWRS
jgi:hypothetical protein